MKLLFKYHASCYMTHAAIDASRSLRETHGFKPEDIEAIGIRIEEACDRICNIPAPTTGLEAKFSLRLTTAMGLAGVDTSRLGSYSEEVAADPVLVGLRDKVSLDLRTGISNTFSEVSLKLRDGRSVSAQHDSGVPASDPVKQGQRLEAKFIALVDPVLGAEAAGTLVSAIRHFDEQPNIRGIVKEASA